MGERNYPLPRGVEWGREGHSGGQGIRGHAANIRLDLEMIGYNTDGLINIQAGVA